jgi:hypothetical protein
MGRRPEGDHAAPKALKVLMVVRVSSLASTVITLAKSGPAKDAG